jgi:hypothetical protein
MAQVPAATPYFVSLPACDSMKMYNMNAAGTSLSAPTVGWQSTYKNTISSGNALFRDMGVNFISAGRVFRKIQYVDMAKGATEGVIGTDATYETAYVETAVPSAGTAGSLAGLARFG